MTILRLFSQSKLPLFTENSSSSAVSCDHHVKATSECQEIQKHEGKIILKLPKFPNVQRVQFFWCFFFFKEYPWWGYLAQSSDKLKRWDIYGARGRKGKAKIMEIMTRDKEYCSTEETWASRCHEDLRSICICILRAGHTHSTHIYEIIWASLRIPRSWILKTCPTKLGTSLRHLFLCLL